MVNSRVGGRYQIVREIAAGGMGRVYQATDLETGRSVAVKVMLATEGDILGALLRFQQEGAVLASLKHPNIVEVYGTYFEGQTAGIAMELLEGSTLAEILRAGPLPLPRAKHLARQTAEALAYAHERGVVHRDIKPGNVFILPGDRVKVTDFGIARILESTVRTPTVQSLGTPLYMSPEQIEGMKIDGRADVYSLGALIFHMVTGRPPFPGEDIWPIMFAHVNKPPPQPQEIDPRMPDDWNALILKALAKSPADRFPSASAMAEAIGQLSAEPREAGAGLEERPESPAPPPPIAPSPPAEPGDGLGATLVAPPVSVPPGGRPPDPSAAPTLVGERPEPQPAPELGEPKPGPQAGPDDRGRPMAIMSRIGLLTKPQLAMLAAAAIVIIALAAFLIGRTMGSGPTPSTPVPTRPPTAQPTARSTATSTPAPSPTPVRAGPTPPPPPGVTANSTVVFSTSLGSASSVPLRKLFYPAGVTVGVVGGYYQIRVTGAGYLNTHDYVMAVGPGRRTDSDVSIAVRVIGDMTGPAPSLRCRDTIPGGNGQERGYAFYLYPSLGQFQLVRYNGTGNSTTLKQGNASSIHRGHAWNEIELRCNRGTMTGSINGRQVVSVADTRYVTGMNLIGVGSSTSGVRSVTAQFANLLLIKPRIRRRDALRSPVGSIFSTYSGANHVTTSFVNGAYLVSIHDRQYLQHHFDWEYSRRIGALDDTRFAIEVRVTPGLSGRVALVACRYAPSDSGYVFEIDPAVRGYILSRNVNGKYTTLKRGTAPLSNGWNRVELRCFGSTIGVAVNGRAVTSATDTTLKSGYIAVGAGAYDSSVSSVDVYFRRALVSSW